MADTNEQDIRRGGLTLEQYAEAEAFVRHYEDDEQSEVLAVLGINPDQWHQASTEWGTMINRALEVGRQDLAVSFAAAFQAARGKLDEELLPLEDRLPAKPVEARLPSAPPPGAPPAGALPRPVPAALQPTPPTGSAEPPAHESTPALGVDETAFALPIVDQPATPFSGSAPPPASALADLGPRPSNVLDETAEVNILHVAETALPFDSDQDPEPGNVLDETAEVSIVHAAEAALPFGPAKAQPPPGEQAELSLEQYASLRAELSCFPERRQPSLARYGIPDEAAATALHAEWTKRFESDPALEARWKSLRDRFCEWLREQGPSAIEPR